MDKKLASWFSYLLGWLSGVIVLVIEKEDKEVRIHAWQSIFMCGAVIALMIVVMILTAIFGAIAIAVPALFFMTFLLLFIDWVVAIAYLVAVILCIVKAVKGDIFKVPVVYGFAAKMK